MLKKIKYQNEASINEILFPKISFENKIAATVTDILKNIQLNGDEALFSYTKNFDNFDINFSNVKVTEEEINSAVETADKEFIRTLKFCFDRIESYHSRQKPIDEKYKDETETTLGWKWSPVDSVGIYVPGGKAFYPSSVLMNAIPALVAGVERIVMVTPANSGFINPILLQAANICGITEIYKIGGAQAVGALTFGTESIKKVVKIVGPGNAYVAEAKRQVFGKVGIDSVAGPSEILVIADETANPKLIAADLLSQAEHDEQARSILVTNSENMADKISKEIEVLIERISRTEIALASMRNNGFAIIVEDIETDSPKIVNSIAPEHLEIITADPEKISRKITNAGAVFLGAYTPEAIGDYVAGPSHVLPTSATAKFSSGLGVLDFMKRTSMIKCSKESFKELAPHAISFAKHEKLDAHALSIKLRM